MGQKDLGSRPSLTISDRDVFAMVQRNRRGPRLAGSLFAFEVVNHQIFEMLHFNSVR